MNLDITQVLKTYDEKPVFKTDVNEMGVAVLTKEKLTLREAISSAINTSTRDSPLTPDQKNKAYQISIKIWAKKKVNLTLTERAFIKERVLIVYNPLVAGRVGDILEGKDEGEEDEKESKESDTKA